MIDGDLASAQHAKRVKKAWVAQRDENAVQKRDEDVWRRVVSR
jgi:hypothetical protein